MYNTENFLKPEIIDGFKVTEKRKRIWNIEIELLQEFDKFCKANNIKYSVAYGTLIGAVRHKGFIPWDDDIDVVVSRKDYEKIIKIAPNCFGGKFHFQSYISEKSYDRTHAQLRNSETTAILRNEIRDKKSFNQGIFIDIFPLDAFPNNRKEQELFINRVAKQKRLIDGFVRYNCYSKHSLLGIIKHHILKIIGLKRLIKHYDNICSNYSKKKTNLVCDIAFWVENYNAWVVDAWEDITDYSFEYTRVPGPKEYDYVLKEQYGNYSEFIIGNSEHGDVFFDTEKPYTYYLNEGREELEKYATTTEH